MAGSIGGSSNYFADINSKIARGPSHEEARTVQDRSGATASQVKSTHAKAAKSIELKDGVTLSLPSQDVSYKSDRDLEVEQHAAEYAETTGFLQTMHDDEGKVLDREAQNHERNTGVEEEQATSMHKVVSPQGVVQALTDDDSGRLSEMDSSVHCKLHLNSDVPKASLEAAGKMIETRRPKDLADMKFGPEAQAAVQPELKSISFTGTMDICQPEAKGMLMEISEESQEMAAHLAAEKLASGEEIMQENLTA